MTYGRTQTRASAATWNAADGDTDFGLSGKFGLTSGITLDGTINPDFSQVESDAFQVEVNRRFPTFFSEKRPFFMEGMGLFDVAGTGGDGNMSTSVHTRRIVNPIWGAKVIGTARRATFGVVSALDEAGPTLNEGAGERRQHKLFTVGRVTYGLRGSDYIGAIVSDTEHGARRNTVAGADVALRFAGVHGLSATFLASDTADGAAPNSRGTASQVTYSYNTRRFSSSHQVEHYGRGFQMDTAFYNRTGVIQGWSFGEINFYPGRDADAWVHRIHPFFFARRGHDEVQGGSEGLLVTGVRVNFTRQGFLSVGHGRGHEAWVDRRFDAARTLDMFGNVQLYRWLELSGGFSRGPDIFYDPVAPFQGWSRRSSVGFTLQPNQRLSHSVDTTMIRFEREAGERVFGVTVLNLRTTFQFNRHFLVRLLEQYDSSEHRFLTDVLASYELAPGTVLHGGYGSLYERRADAAGTLVGTDVGERYLTVNRGIFLKASYLHRF